MPPGKAATDIAHLERTGNVSPRNGGTAWGSMRAIAFPMPTGKKIKGEGASGQRQYGWSRGGVLVYIFYVHV